MAKSNPKKLINESAKMLRQIMQAGLTVISDEMIIGLSKGFDKTSAATELEPLKDVSSKGLRSYKSALKDAFTVIATRALKEVRTELPKQVRLDESFKLAAYDLLPVKIRKQIEAQAELLSVTQFNDLKKEISFQYLSSAPSTDSMASLINDLQESADSFAYGASVNAGSVTAAAQNVNNVRTEFLFEADSLEQIEAFEFVNGDPVSEICQNLAGTIFFKDDPESFQFFPPLHFNCKSYVRPLIKVPRGKEIQKLQPSTQKARDSIQFAEHKCPHC